MLTGATGVRSMVAAGVRVIRGRLRRTPPVQSAEQLLCNSSRPVSALTSSSALTAKAIAAGANELVMEAGEPVPRLVFGGVLSFEETKEATTELKEVLDAMYLSSPKSFESETSLIHGISLPLNTEIVDNGSGVIMENNTSNPGPEHVHEALRLLSCSPTIQNTFASAASDPKVWEAVLENSEVKKFFLAYQTSADTFEGEANVTQEGESGVGVMEKLRNLKDLVIKTVTNVPIHLPDLFGSSAIESASGSDHKENTNMKGGKSGSGFVEKLRNLKNSVVGMATNIPNYRPNLYGSSAAKSDSGSVHKGNTESSPPELSLGTSLTGLAPPLDRSLNFFDVQSTEQFLCNSSRPVSALTSSSSRTAKAIAAEENELVMEAGEPVPRLVFGGVPSVEETEEATTELKEVLDAMYLSSPKSFESETSLIPGISLPLNTEIVDNGSGVIMENNTSNPGPEHVHEALRLLSCSPTIQHIFASAASDPKVYKAVLENSGVKKLFLAYQTSAADTFEDEANVTQEGESGAGVMEKLRNLKDLVIKMVTNVPIHLPDLFGSSAIESASGSDHKENTNMKGGKSGSGFVEKLRNLKNSVVGMATNIPNYLPNLYGSSAAKSDSGSDHKGNTESSPPELSLGTSLTGLAIMVIMIVLFKRV